MFKQAIKNFSCLFSGHKAMFFVSSLGHSPMTMHDYAGRELVSIHLCRNCRSLFWKRGQDVPSSMDSGWEIELFDAKNYVNRMTKAISSEAKDTRGEEEA